jgi:Predicted membrane protein (DUF2142)
MIRTLLRRIASHVTRGTWMLPWLFLSFAAPTCLFLALAVPPGQVPDEPAHVARAMSLLHGEIMGHRHARLDGAGHPIMGSGVLVNAGPVDADFGNVTPPPQHKWTLQDQQRLNAVPWDHALTYFDVPNTSVYFPIFYVPMAIGLVAGHLTRTTPLTAILMARVASTIVYLVLGWLALRLARRGQLGVFATLMLPMTLSLAGSCNQDGLVIGAACLAAALLTRATTPRGAAYWTAGILLACVVAVKPPYLPLAAAMLLPCMLWERRQLGRAVAGVLLAALPGVAWALLALHAASAPFVFGPPYHPGPLWPGDPNRLFPSTDMAAQALIFLHHPALMISMPLDAMWQLGGLLTQSIIGRLGLIDIVLAGNAYVWWYVALGAAAAASLIASPQDDGGPRAIVSALVLLAVAATVFAVCDLQYLSWTTVGRAQIDGIQGRYFLPLMPIIAVALPAIRWRQAAWVQTALALPAVVLAGVGMIYLPQLILSAYYLR